MRWTAPAIVLASAATRAAAMEFDECYEGVFMPIVRGTTEDEGPGISGAIGNRIADRIPGSKVHGIDYPASAFFPWYTESEERGQLELRKVLIDYHRQCPKGKIGLIGYSQGAQVVNDVMCGSSGGDFNEIWPINRDVLEDTLVATILFGDPTFEGNANFTRGTGNYTGIWERREESTEVCESYSERLISYCDKGDIFCDDGSEPLEEAHLEYVQTYGDEVVEFFAKRWEKMTGEKVKAESQQSIDTWAHNGTYLGSGEIPTLSHSSSVSGDDDEKIESNESRENSTSTDNDDNDEEESESNDDNDGSNNDDEDEDDSDDDNESAAFMLGPVGSLVRYGLPLALIGMFQLL